MPNQPLLSHVSGLLMSGCIIALSLCSCESYRDHSNLEGEFAYLDAAGDPSRVMLYETTRLPVAVTAGHGDEPISELDLSIWLMPRVPGTFAYELRQRGQASDGKTVLDTDRWAHMVDRLSLRAGETANLSWDLPSIVFENFDFKIGLAEDDPEVDISGGAPGVVITWVISSLMGEQDDALLESREKIDVDSSKTYLVQKPFGRGGQLLVQAERKGGKIFSRADLQGLVAESLGYQKALLENRDRFDDGPLNIDWNQFLQLMRYETYRAGLSKVK